jgi:putative lipoic acid-binding regulatory protein
MQDDKPKIEFPCAYPVKVLGLHAEDFAVCMVEILQRHDPGLIQEKISYRESRGGRYLSLTATITATGPEQLQALFDELKASGRVALVL